jgi:hypothetical protein
MFYSKSTFGFYDADVAKDKLPADVVPTTKQEQDALMAEVVNGKVIVVSKDGKLSLAAAIAS